MKSKIISIVTKFQKKFCQYHFCLPHSPTYYNLCKYLHEQGWLSTKFKSRANLSEKNFLFYSLAAECLEFKNLLAKLVAQYCPQVMPVTFCINDENWPEVLNQIAKEYYDPDNLDQINHLAWILKPALLNNGQHIKIFQHLHELKQHYLNANRLGGEHVLQQYLIQPHLLKGPEQGHKYCIRMFVILTNYAGAYLYPNGYFNVALHPYKTNEFTDLRSHLTNEHLQEGELNVVQIPTQQYDLFKSLYPQIKAIISATITGLQKLHPAAFICEKQRTLAIFGFDFIVDSGNRVWLLEANHGPCFPTSDEHPLQASLYYDFWQAVITSFVMPITKNQATESIFYHPFEIVGNT
jgi:hypothetical protein